MSQPKTYSNTPIGMRANMSISAKWALDKHLWDGKSVCVSWVGSRGHAHRRTLMGAAFGILVLDAGTEQQIGLKPFANSPDEDIMLIHVSRSTRIYDPSRKAEAKA